MSAILISRAHEWRGSNEGVTCLNCDHFKRFGERSYVPCRRHGEHPTSGYSGVLIENGKYLGRFRMAGKHPDTGRPFAQWYMKEVAA